MPEPTARHFYGGEPLTGIAGGGVEGRKYEGPEARVAAPWNCPKCGVLNEGRLELGCTSCGAGKPGYHVDQTPLAPREEPVAIVYTPPIVDQAWLQHWEQVQLESPVRALQAEDLIEAAFRAGWIAGALNQARRERADIAAPPPKAAPEILPAEQKPRRTILAALELFKDQVLAGDPEEIGSGEWCSVAEVDQLLAQLRSGLDA